MKKVEFACNRFRERNEGNQCKFYSVKAFVRMCKGRQLVKKKMSRDFLTGSADPACLYGYQCDYCTTKDKVNNGELNELPSSMLVVRITRVRPKKAGIKRLRYSERKRLDRVRRTKT